MTTTVFSLSSDTQAILLLCAHFGSTLQNGVKPLNNREYNLLARILQQEQFRPGDLLNKTIIDWLDKHQDNTLEPQRIQQLLDRGALLAIKVEEWTNQGLWILSRGDALYPKRFKVKLKHQAPPLLYGIGNIDLLDKGGIAIVGSRSIDEEGLAYTRYISKLCAQSQIGVVSGGARGVDQEAMLAVLAEGGNSIGILANDLGKDSVSKKYKDAIRANQLVLISPYDPHSRFQVGNAMGRNKYIYALADQSLVVSSDYNSGGTWAGAIEELRRDNAIPVWVRFSTKLPEGNAELLKLGAKPLPDELLNRGFLGKLGESQLKNGSQNDNVNISQIVQSSDLIKKTNKIEEQDKISPIYSTPSNTFEAILPLLLDYLTQPRKTLKEIACYLEVQQNQAKVWLNKTIEMELVEKGKSGYHSIRKDSSSGQLSLSLDMTKHNQL